MLIIWDVKIVMLIIWDVKIVISYFFIYYQNICSHFLSMIGAIFYVSVNL